MGTDGLIIPAGSTTEPEPDALSSPITAAEELLLLLPPPPPPPPPTTAAKAGAGAEAPPVLLAPTGMRPAGCGSGPDTGLSLAI